MDATATGGGGGVGIQCVRPAQGGYKVPRIVPEVISGLENQDV